MPERRPKAYKSCPVDGCDWRLVTEWFDGSPDNTTTVPMIEQQRIAGEHMRVHFTPERTYFT